MSLFPEIGTAIKRAEARVDAFPTALFHGFNAVRPRKIYEKSHVYPISIQDAFKPVEDGEDVFRWEQVRDTKAPLRLYAHIPWCEVKCSFCRYIIDRRDPTADLVAPYFAAMRKELNWYADRIGRDTIQTEVLYIGGGTPSTLSPSQIDDLFDLIRERIEFVPDAFLIVESSPGTLTKDKIKAFRRNGINRISMGVQTFNEDLLKKLRRDHSAERVKQVYDWIREEGIEEVNFDLMLALPDQTPESFATTLQTAVELAPSSISLLDLYVAPGSELFARGFSHNYRTNLIMRAMYQDLFRSTQYAQSRTHYYVRRDEMKHPSTRCPAMDPRVDPGFQLGIGLSSYTQMGDAVGINDRGRRYQDLVEKTGRATARYFRIGDEDRTAMRAIRTLNDARYIPKRPDVTEQFREELEFLRAYGLIDEEQALTDDGSLFGTEMCFFMYPRHLRSGNSELLRMVG